MIFRRGEPRRKNSVKLNMVFEIHIDLFPTWPITWYACN